MLSEWTIFEDDAPMDGADTPGLEMDATGFATEPAGNSAGPSDSLANMLPTDEQAAMLIVEACGYGLARTYTSQPLRRVGSIPQELKRQYSIEARRVSTQDERAYEQRLDLIQELEEHVEAQQLEVLPEPYSGDVRVPQTPQRGQTASLRPITSPPNCKAGKRNRRRAKSTSGTPRRAKSTQRKDAILGEKEPSPRKRRASVSAKMQDEAGENASPRRSTRLVEKYGSKPWSVVLQSPKKAV